MEQQDLNKRLMLALVLSFVIMVGFSYLMPQKPPLPNEANKTSPNQASTSSTPSNSVSTTNAPKAPVTTTDISTQTPANDQNRSSEADNAIATVRSADFVYRIDSLGRISSAKLLEKKYQTEDGKPLELFDPKYTKPLEIRFDDKALNNEAFRIKYTSSSPSIDVTDGAKELVLAQKLNGLSVEKKLVFYPDGHYDISIHADKPVNYFLTPGHRPEADHARYMVVRGALVRDTKGVLTTVEDGKADKTESIKDATILSAFDRYAASMFYRFDTPFHAVLMPEADEKSIGFVSIKGDDTLHGYIGPKEYRTLQKLNPHLTDAIEFGWFTFLSRPFFKVMLWIHDFVGNWGWAIILFTILVKLVLFPLSYKGMMSMQKMKDLAPKMKELKEKYKGDPAKLNQQTMALYKKHGVNPMGGCLPMLLQIPIFFALYRVLLNADELQGAPWIGWITNLADKDPIYILPILMGASMWLMQKVQPNTMTDPMQQKIFQWFPAIMTFFFLTFPAGLVLYWLTNNILSILQQFIINRSYEKHKMNLKTKAVEE